MIRKRTRLVPLLCGGMLAFSGLTASAHLGYSGRDFGTVVANAAPITISGQSITSNYGWADGTDDDFGDSHKLRIYRFTLAAPAYVTISASASTNGGLRDGNLKPGFSVFQGLAHTGAITASPGSADHDFSAISQAYLASLGGLAKEGCFRALTDWRIGGDNQTGPSFDFEAADGLSTFLFRGYAVDGDASLFGPVAGITGDGVADGKVTRTFYLAAGDYSVLVGGANYAMQAPTPDTTSYGVDLTISASAFVYTAGDPADGGIPYAHQVTMGTNSSGSFSSHVGAWSWEDDSLFSVGEPTVGWTHTSNWVALKLTQDTNLTLTMTRDANVPWPSAEEPDRKADTASMFPSLTLYKGWDNDGEDYHTYNNRGDVDWAEDIKYVDHIDNSTETTITRTWYLPAGDYTLALGSNAPADNLSRQGFNIQFDTTPCAAADPVANTYPPPDYIGTGGIGYAYTVIAGANDSGSFSSHVGAWSWEDNSLFSPGQMAVGWTHTSNWVALKLNDEVLFSLTVERDANVPWPSVEEPDRKADTTSMFPSLTLYRGWDNDGSDFHTYNNHGNVVWAEDLRYIDHIDNSTEEKITRTWRLPAGEYSIVIGSNAPANNASRQGYKATYSTQPAASLVNADPGGDGITYSHIISVGRGDSGSFSDHVGAWSWEDNSLFGAGDPPVGWTHTSRWLGLQVRDSVSLTVTMSRDGNVPWPSSESPDRKADTTSMFPSFTLWRGWDDDGGDNHTYNNRGDVDWAEDLSYIDHYDNSTAETITRTYTLAPGMYTFALGSNAPAENSNRQGFQFAWTTSAPVLIAPVVTGQPKSVTIIEGKSAAIGVKASGPSLGYQWLFAPVSALPDIADGTSNTLLIGEAITTGVFQPVSSPSITDGTSNTIKISEAIPEDDGYYVCVVRNGAGWSASDLARVTVLSIPVVDPFTIANRYIGESSDIAFTAANNPDSFALKSKPALPKGLKFDAKTGRLTGRPLAPGTFALEITAKNKAGTSDKVTGNLTVLPLVDGIAGSFMGSLGRDAGINGYLGGCVKVEVATTGAYSGSVVLGAKTYRVSGALDTSMANPTGSLSLPRPGQAPLALSFTVYPSAGTLYGTIDGGASWLPFSARQRLANAGTYPGNYTLALGIDALDEGNQDVPQGFSIGAFKVAATGAVSGVLTLSDKTTVTFSGPLETSGNLTVFSLLYSGNGSFTGVFNLQDTTGDLLASEVSWFKDGRPKDRAYKEGFGPLDLDVVGRKYSIPANGIPMGVDAGAGNAALSFAEGGVPDPETRLNVPALEVKAGNGKAATIPAPNPGNVKLTTTPGIGDKFTAGTTGTFKGSFDLTDTDTSVTPNKAAKRKADFQGVIVDDGYGQIGYGFFLLNQMPTASPKTTLTTSPILSGRVVLEPVTP